MTYLSLCHEVGVRWVKFSGERLDHVDIKSWHLASETEIISALARLRRAGTMTPTV